MAWISLYLGLSQPLSGQQLSFRYLGNEQGLNSLSSWSCTIDKYGYFWISTSDGLVRFDGKETRYFFKRDYPQMPTDQIGHVFCDNLNQIWVCTDKGLARVDANRQIFREIIDAKNPGTGINFCMASADHTTYVLTSAGAFAREHNAPAWHSQPWLDSLIDGRRYREAKRFDQDRYMVVFPAHGVMLLNLKEKKQDAFIEAKIISCATRFDHNSILIGNGRVFGLYRVFLDNPDSLHKISPPDFFTVDNLHEQIRAIDRAADGNVYIATVGKGLLVLDETLIRYNQYTHDLANPATITNNSLRNVIADSSGSLLVTSLDGINYTNVHNTAVEYINYLRTEEGQMVDSRVLSIAEDKDKQLWICTRDDVLIYDPKRNTTRKIFIPASVKLWSETLAPIYVERDDHDRMWVSLRADGLIIFDANGTFIKHISSSDYPGHRESIDRTRIIREGHDGFVYLGTENGLFRISHEGFLMDSFADHPGLLPLRNERIVDILTDENSLWVSSSPRGGAWHYRMDEGKLDFYNHQNGLPTDRIYGIATDEEKNIYLGSYSGFSVLDGNDSITNYVKGRGLIGPRIESIETADDGTVWMANNYNILKYDPADRSISKLGGRQGLRNINFAVMASVKLSSGKLAFGANKGFIMVDPATIKFGLDSFDVFTFYHNTEGEEIELIPGSHLKFGYKKQNLRISFGISDMMIADQVLYKYRMSSDDDVVWSTPSASSTADFNLAPGNYTFEVEAFDGHEWFGLSAPVHFHVTPPWWRQWWFVSMMIIGILLSAWAVFNSRISKLRKEILIARQISELESKALRAQMNPHFVFNSLNAIQECIVTGKVDEAYTYLSKFSRLLRLVLEHSDVPEVSLHEELEVLNLYVSLEKLRFKDDMDFMLKMDDELDTEEILIPPMLVQPHLENAIWHGLRHQQGAKQLLLAISENPAEYLEVIIEDNGIGRKKAGEMQRSRLGGNKHNSKGRQLSENRMELIRQAYPLTSINIIDLHDEAGVAKGTRVILKIPMMNKTPDNSHQAAS